MRAKELGYTTVGITEHGVLTSTYDFMDIAKDLGLKPIPGVEAYIGPQKMHMCLFPKSEKGYHAISKAVTESYKTLIKDIPVMSDEILEQFFGEGTEGHNEVIASSACVGGVICSILNENNEIKKSIKKLEKNLSSKKEETFDEEKYEKEKNEYNSILERLDELSDEIKEARADTKLTYKKQKKTLDSFQKDDDGYEQAYQAYKERIDRIEAAKLVLPKLLQKKETLTKEKNKRKTGIEKAEKVVAKTKVVREKIAELKKTYKDDAVLYKEAKERAQYLSQLFGDGNFYLEIQYHNIPVEEQIMPIIADIAIDLSLPLIATNDAHMVNPSEKELNARQYIRAMRFNTWQPAESGDKELYVKSEDELHDVLAQIFPEDIIQQAFSGANELADKCNVVFEKNSHYPVYQSEIKNETSADCLRRLCAEGIKKRFKEEEWTEEYQKRMEYELDVIIRMNYADYHCIVADYLNYGKLIGKIDFSKYENEYNKDPYNIAYLEELVKRTNGVGEGIGPGRGSAAGSLVCFLIGITDIDPIKYNLLFERFLNVERVSMPDIDSDFSPEIREKVINYVRYKYGDDAVCLILTTGMLWAKKAIRNVARIHGLRFKDNNMYYSKLADELCKKVPNTLGVRFKDFLYDTTTTDDETGCTVITPGLYTIYKSNKEAVDILKIAETMEGTFVDYGMHAAGVIIADNNPVKNYVPLMCNDGTNWVCQCDKERAEEIGLLKMDFLGLKNLAIITNALRLIQKHTGKMIDMQNIDFNDPNVLKLYATGFTNGIFQVESPGMKSINQEFMPTSFEDVILIIAAYRPGPMDFIPDIIAVKHGLKQPNYIIPEMGEILDNTYGCPVYQEQLMEIFHRFANFSLGEADIVRRYMSKKKVDKFLAFKDKFIDGFVENGAKREKADSYWNDLINFAKYAFNKSHAAAYAVVSYQTAWLKCYYPREYFCALIDSLDTNGISKKIRGIESDLKALGYHIQAPDINLSNTSFDIYNENPIYGFSSIRAIGNGLDCIVEERNKNGKFTSIYDFIERTMPGKKILTSMIYSGCFDSIHPNRSEWMDDGLIEAFSDISKKLKKASEEKKEEIKKELHNIRPNPSIRRNEDEELRQEKHYLGSYFSRNPLQNLPEPKDIGCVAIEDVNGGEIYSISGMINDLRITHRKSDNAEMAFFTLGDKTAEIDVNCFTGPYAKYKRYIEDGKRVIITGKVTRELAFGVDEDDGNEDNYVMKMTVKQIEELTDVMADVIIPVKNVIEWHTKLQEKVTPYIVPHGHPLVLFDLMTGRLRPTKIQVNDKFDVSKL